MAIIMFVFERRATKLQSGLVVARPKPSVSAVCSAIDLGGVLLAVVSLAFILVPLSLASLQPQGYRTPWVIALFVLGPIGLLVLLPLYESRIATRPFFPSRYIKHRAIALALLLYFLDFMAVGASHNYLYNWAVIAQNMSILQATYLSNVNGVTIAFVGMGFGLVMWKTRRYKWWVMLGCAVRLLGYGLMFRIRTEADPSYVELYMVQFVQGVGDSLVQTGGYVAATINVPHKEVAQMTALAVLVGILGSSVGGAISGAIYTGTFREELAKQLGDNATPELINTLFNSITGDIPAWGTPERLAINRAVSIMSVDSSHCVNKVFETLTRMFIPSSTTRSPRISLWQPWSSLFLASFWSGFCQTSGSGMPFFPLPFFPRELVTQPLTTFNLQ